MGAPRRPLTLLSFGGGQDSTAILYRILHEPGLRQAVAPGDLVVVMADTGNEHPDTYAHVQETRRLCAWWGLPFVFLDAAAGYHSPSWRTLEHQYRLHSTIGSAAFGRACTDNLKLQPIFRWLDDEVARRYGYPNPGRKVALGHYTREFGPLCMLLGIAAGEEKRVARADTSTRVPAWVRRCLTKRYPLIEWGWDRAACQAYIATLGLIVPPPSNCVLCHYKSPIEVLWTARQHPAAFATWVELEAAKLAKNAGRAGKNLGVYGTRTLPEVLARAEKEHGHMTTEELSAYRFSHGHCVRNAY